MGSQMLVVEQENVVKSELVCLKKLENHLSQATASKRRPSLMEAYFQEIDFYANTGSATATRRERNGVSGRLQAKFR